MNREEVMEEWKKTLDELAKAREDLAHINAEIPRVKDSLAKLEAEVYLMVSSEKDESGKLVYSNESLRQKATLLRLSTLESYTKLHSILRRYEEERERLIAKISNLKDRVEFFKYLLGDGSNG